MTTCPGVPLARATYLRGAWTLTVVCPHCGHLHSHGGGIDPSTVAGFLGHRAAHCPSACPTHGQHEQGRGYVLTDPNGVATRAAAELQHLNTWRAS